MRHFAAPLILAVLATPSALPADRAARAARRSEPRDQAAAQRKSTPVNRVKRSTAARRQFQREHPCPATGKTTGACPGYVGAHMVALKRGGA